MIVNEGLQQISEGIDWKLALLRGLLKGDKDGMSWRLARIHGTEFPAPPFEQAEAFGGVADFVAEIIAPAAIGIDVVEILVEFPGKQEADDMEILVVFGGEPAGVGQRRVASADRGEAAGCRLYAVRTVEVRRDEIRIQKFGDYIKTLYVPTSVNTSVALTRTSS